MPILEDTGQSVVLAKAPVREVRQGEAIPMTVRARQQDGSPLDLTGIGLSALVRFHTASVDVDDAGAINVERMKLAIARDPRTLAVDIDADRTLGLARLTIPADLVDWTLKVGATSGVTVAAVTVQVDFPNGSRRKPPFLLVYRPSPEVS